MDRWIESYWWRYFCTSSVNRCSKLSFAMFNPVSGWAVRKQKLASPFQLTNHRLRGVDFKMRLASIEHFVTEQQSKTNKNCCNIWPNCFSREECIHRKSFGMCDVFLLLTGITTLICSRKSVLFGVWRVRPSWLNCFQATQNNAGDKWGRTQPPEPFPQLN